MISRVAEHCFWMARYLERAENTARILEVNHTLLLDFQVPVEQQWRPLLIISGIHDFKPEPTADNVLDFMTWDAENACSITSSLGMARENARIIREVISAEMWERLNYYHLWLQSDAAAALYKVNRTDFYAHIRRVNQMVHGIADGTMSHGKPWEFVRLGMCLERASQTARLLDVKYHMLLPRVEDVGTPIDVAHWFAILMSCSGYEPFHKKLRHMPIEQGAAVAEFLILDEQFPRSIQWSLVECRRVLARLSDDQDHEAARGLDALLAWLNARGIADIIQNGLHESLTFVVNSIHEIAGAIHRTYFNAVLPRPGRQSQSQSQSQGKGQSQSQSQSQR